MAALSYLARDLDSACWRNLCLPAPGIAAQGNLLRAIDLDHATPGWVSWGVRTHIGVKDRTELSPMGREHLLHGPPHVHLADRHGLAIGMLGRVGQRRRDWQRARRRDELPSPSEKAPEEDHHNEERLEKTGHTVCSFGLESPHFG